MWPCEGDLWHRLPNSANFGEVFRHVVVWPKNSGELRTVGGKVPPPCRLGPPGSPAPPSKQHSPPSVPGIACPTTHLSSPRLAPARASRALPSGTCVGPY